MSYFCQPASWNINVFAPYCISWMIRLRPQLTSTVNAVILLYLCHNTLSPVSTSFPSLNQTLVRVFNLISPDLTSKQEAAFETLRQTMEGVPKFGNWENNDNVPYTEYFDKARKGKAGGKSSGSLIENSSSESKQSLAQQTQPKLLDERRPIDKPNNYGDRTQRNVSDSMQSRDRTGLGDQQRRTTRESERNMDNLHGNSPLHGKAAEKSGSASPYRSQGLGSSTTERLQLRQNNVQAKSTAVPKFGDWNEQDPDAGGNFTAVFGRVKNEMHGSEKPSADTSQSVPTSYHGRAENSESSGCCCFSWFKS